MYDDAELKRMAQVTGERLLGQQLSLATAESCTGGWIAKLLTDIAGSSAWFERGFVTYSNAAKQDSLGVPATLIERQGAVSRETVAAMVSGALIHSQADLALAVTGIAGPGGGRADKPVGTVWFGWARRGQAPVTELQQLPGDRDAVRRQAVHHALEGLGRVLLP